MTTTVTTVSTPCPMIRTKYLGPTNTRGSRIKAWSVGVGDRPNYRLTVAYRSELDSFENHAAAALALHEQLRDGAYTMHSTSEDGGGYVFAFVAAQEVAK